MSTIDTSMYYAQLQQYIIHSSNYVYSVSFVVGAILLIVTIACMIWNINKIKSYPTISSNNFITGFNPSILAHFLILLYSISLIFIGYLGIRTYYYELSPVTWTKLFNQVIVCNGSTSNVNYIDTAFYKYHTTLHDHDLGTKTALLLSIENFIGNNTAQGKDISQGNAFSINDGSFISVNRPPLLDYRNLFSRHYPFIYFTVLEQMEAYLMISLVQFSSFSFLTSSIFITLSALRASALTYFDASPTGLFSSPSIVLMNLYGISRLIFFPVLDLWTNGGFVIINPKIVNYFLSFEREAYSNDEDGKNERFSWPLGCLKHYVTIVERILLFMLISFALGKLKVKKTDTNAVKFCTDFTPEEIIPFLLLLQPKQNHGKMKTYKTKKPALYSYLNILRFTILWNILSHIAIFSLSLSFKQLSLLQSPMIADFLSLSVISSEMTCVIILLLSLSSLSVTSSLFWRTPNEIESDIKYDNYSKYNYSKKLDVNDPEDLDDAFEEINSASAIPRAIYKPPSDYELPVWAKDSNIKLKENL